MMSKEQANTTIRSLEAERAQLLLNCRALQEQLQKTRKRLGQLDALLEGATIGIAAAVEPTPAPAVPSPAATE